MFKIMNKKRTILAGAMSLALIGGAAPLAATTAEAVPTIPDNLPVFPQVKQNPKINVTTTDGRPVNANTTVHRGDQLIVRGTGFSPKANKGGFPLPVPPGVSNGVYVLYSAFPDNWKPSKGAPSENRTHPHGQMAWVTPPGTLTAIPRQPINMHRSIARVSQPMNNRGGFTAKITVNPPEDTPGKNWGIYVYPAAGSNNPAEEIFVPINYSPEPGPNTPREPTPDLVFDADLVYKFTTKTKGGLSVTDGAAKQGKRFVSFSRADKNSSQAGVQKNKAVTKSYQGLATATARFNVVEKSMKNPRIEKRGKLRVLTALVSTAHDVGPDHMRRVELGTLGPKASNGFRTLLAGPVTVGHVKVNG